MLKQIKDWLGDKKRDYKQGVALFEQLASDGIKEKYLAYFKKQDNPAVLSIEFTMLINKISDIERKLRVQQQTGQPLPVAKTVQDPASEKGNQKTVDFGEINPDELPDDLKEAYARLKEIKPLQAKFHADLKNASLSPKKRHDAALELIALENERTELWRKFEVHFNADVSVTLPTEDKEQESDFVRGFEAAKNIAKLKENIANCKVTEANGNAKPTTREKAKTRRGNYEKELAGILTELSAK